MTMPAEDAYWQIGTDTTQFWSTAQKAYVVPGNAGLLAWLAKGNMPLPALTEAALNQTLADLGLGDLAPSNVTDQIRGLDPILFKIAFNHENRIRTLAGQPTVTAAQFKTALRALLA